MKKIRKTNNTRDWMNDLANMGAAEMKENLSSTQIKLAYGYEQRERQLKIYQQIVHIVHNDSAA